MAAKIEVDFAELMSISGELRELAEEIQKHVQGEMQGGISLLRAGWNSICADKLARKEAEIADEIARQSEALTALAQEIEQGARKLYQSEIANQVRAKTRIYI